MSFSDFLKETKEKYQPKEMNINITKCSHCKHPETKYCLMCEDCGRKFEKGKMVKDVD